MFLSSPITVFSKLKPTSVTPSPTVSDIISDAPTVSSVVTDSPTVTRANTDSPTESSVVTDRPTVAVATEPPTSTSTNPRTNPVSFLNLEMFYGMVL